MKITMSQFEILRQKNGENLKLLDVRPKMSYDAGHIKGAISMPLEQIDFRLAEFREDEVYYIICSAGVRSEQAVDRLTKYGYQAVEIEGGMLRWNGEVTTHE